MEFVGFLNRFTPRQRISAILVFGAVMAAALYYNDAPEVAVAPPLPVKQTAPGPVQAQLPQGVPTGQVVRDPFAVPAEFAPAKLLVNPNGTGMAPFPTGSGIPAPVSGGGAGASSLPVLTGIVGGEGRWAAIIQSGGTSRSYQQGDTVGSYQVVAITATSATISGPGGSAVLKVSAPQQAAPKSEASAAKQDGVTKSDMAQTASQIAALMAQDGNRISNSREGEKR
mgnify:CR=1 FL=1